MDAGQDEREDEEDEPGRGSLRERGGGTPRVRDAPGEGRRHGRASRTSGVVPGERLGESRRVDGLLGEDVQQDKRGRYRHLRDHRSRGEPDRGRREGKQQRRARQVGGGHDELTPCRGAMPAQPVNPAGQQPAEAGGGRDRRGRAWHPVTGGEGPHRDPHGAEEQPDGQVEQCEEEGRPQQGRPCGAGMSGALAGGPRRGPALRGQRRSPAENQARGDTAGQGRVTDRAERGDQDGPEKESGGVGQRFQREGGGQLAGPLATQQVRPAGPGQRAELGNDRTGAGRGGDLRCRSGGRKDTGDSGGMGEEAERQDAGLAEPVDQAGQMRTDQSLGEGESSGGKAGGAVGAGAGV